MKLVLLTLLVALGCSKQNHQPNKPLTIDNQLVMEMAPETIDLSVIEGALTGIIVSSDSVDFGDVFVGAKATKRVTLQAKTEIPQLDTSGFQNSPNFKVVVNTCGTSLHRLRACIIDLEFSPASPGSISELMNLNASLNFTVKANAVPAIVKQASDYAELITVTTAVNLGDFTGLKKTGKITILNMNSSPVDVVIDTSLLEEQGLSYVSYCPVAPTKLKSKFSCQVEVSYFSDIELMADAPKSANVVVNSLKNSQISVVHKATVQAETTSFSWATNPVNLGSIGSQKLQLVYVSNGGSSDLTGLSFNSLPVGVSVNRTNCNAVLKSKRQCFVEFKFSPSQMIDGAFSFDYLYSNSKNLAKLTLNATISGGIPATTQCTLADVQANGWNTANYSALSGIKNGTNISACAVSQCIEHFAVMEKSCSRVSCPAGFFLNGQLCSPDVITYEPIYSEYGSCSVTAPCSGAGSKTREVSACQKVVNGSPVSGGQLSDCASFATSENLTQVCGSPAGNVTANIEGGVQTFSCPINSTTQSFLSVSCNSGFFISGQICSPDVITYEPVYSEYGVCSASACAGLNSGTQARSIASCQKKVNGINTPGGILSDCSSYATSQNLEQLCSSPAGTKDVELAGNSGVIKYTCLAGKDTQDASTTSIITCTSGYRLSDNSCVFTTTGSSKVSNLSFPTVNLGDSTTECSFQLLVSGTTQTIALRTNLSAVNSVSSFYSLGTKLTDNSTSGTCRTNTGTTVTAPFNNSFFSASLSSVILPSGDVFCKSTRGNTSGFIISASTYSYIGDCLSAQSYLVGGLSSWTSSARQVRNFYTGGTIPAKSTILPRFAQKIGNSIIMADTDYSAYKLAITGDDSFAPFSQATRLNFTATNLTKFQNKIFVGNNSGFYSYDDTTESITKIPVCTDCNFINSYLADNVLMVAFAKNTPLERRMFTTTDGVNFNQLTYQTVSNGGAIFSSGTDIVHNGNFIYFSESTFAIKMNILTGAIESIPYLPSRIVKSNGLVFLFVSSPNKVVKVNLDGTYSEIFSSTYALDKVTEGPNSVYFSLNIADQSRFDLYRISGAMNSAALSTTGYKTNCTNSDTQVVNPLSGSLLFRCDIAVGSYRISMIKPNDTRVDILDRLMSSGTTIYTNIYQSRNNYNSLLYKGKFILMIFEGANNNFMWMDSADQLSALEASPQSKFRGSTFSLIEDQIYFAGSGLLDNNYQLYKYYEP